MNPMRLVDLCAFSWQNGTQTYEWLCFCGGIHSAPGLPALTWSFMSRGVISVGFVSENLQDKTLQGKVSLLAWFVVPPLSFGWRKEMFPG